jgi:DegV family protein with EDD domain
MTGEKIIVVTDSSASLPVQIMEGLDLRVIPLWLVWENETFRDGVDINPQIFYSRLRGSNTIPSSTQPSVQEFVDFFQECQKEADAIVCVLASSKISGTVDSALSAKEMVPGLPIRVIDSNFSAMGQGFIAVAAARTAAAGKSINEVVLAAERMRDVVNLLFVVDTLEYLHKGGRIGGAKWLLGTAMNIKPLLHFEDGLITSLSQTRTKKKGVLELLDIAEDRLGGSSMVEAAVVHVDCLDEGKELMEKVKDRFNPSNIYISDVSPVVGTHVGPGGLGLAFYPES